MNALLCSEPFTKGVVVMVTESESKARNGHSDVQVPGRNGKKTAQRIQNPVRPKLLSVKEAARYLGVSTWTMRNFAWTSVIPFVQFPNGRKLYFDVLDLEEVVRRNKIRN
jgi:excisionase family DNA binding protein